MELPGWKCDMTQMQSEDEFPEEFNAYLSFLEEELGVRIKIVTVGPDKEQTIQRYNEKDKYLKTRLSYVSPLSRTIAS